jgi:hypothetical protein
MCGADQLLRVGAFHPFKTGVKAVGLLAQRPALCRHGAFAMLQIAFPVRQPFLMNRHVTPPVMMSNKKYSA